MRLRKKIVLLLTLVLGVSLVGTYAIQRQTVYRSFEELEREEAAKNWQRCRAAIEREVSVLSMFCLDWAGWDDMYNYVQGRNPALYESSLANKEYFADQNLPVMYICRPDGTVYWGQILNTDTLEPAAVGWLPPQRLPSDHPLLAVEESKDSEVAGLVMTEMGPMMVASRPILTSNYEGPMAGVLIFGRLLSDEMVRQLREQTRVDFATWPVGTARADISPLEQSAAETAAQSGQVVVQTIDDQRLSVLGTLNDINGRPVLNLRAKLTRQITGRGRKAMEMATYSLAVSGVVTLTVLIGALSWLVVNPLARVTAHATHVGATGGVRKPLELRRRDELGMLAGAINDMLAKLDDYRFSAMKMSRQAGIAELATGVLHNIGNALTNANVLTTVMSEKARKSKVSALAKTAALVREHENDLPRFLTEDRQGRHLVSFLGQLAGHLEGEMAETQKDLAALAANLEHIKQILGAQQSLAKSSNVIERVDVKDTVTKALSVMQASLKRHGITVEVVADPAPVVKCDRVKLAQILVNLLTNAKDAMRDGAGQRKITVRMGQVSDREAYVEVQDNGVGIPRQDLAQVFNEGFTTKRDGLGFGLHYSALAAGEMGGRLTASSEGVGKGATFRLTLPLKEVSQEVTA